MKRGIGVYMTTCNTTTKRRYFENDISETNSVLSFEESRSPDLKLISQIDVSDSFIPFKRPKTNNEHYEQSYIYPKQTFVNRNNIPSNIHPPTEKYDNNIHHEHRHELSHRDHFDNYDRERSLKKHHDDFYDRERYEHSYRNFHDGYDRERYEHSYRNLHDGYDRERSEHSYRNLHDDSYNRERYEHSYGNHHDVEYKI